MYVAVSGGDIHAAKTMFDFLEQFKAEYLVIASNKQSYNTSSN
jgi:hypothetical protein